MNTADKPAREESVSLEKLKVLTSELNTERNRLCEQMALFEAEINKIAPGVSSWYIKGRYALGYSRLKSKWGIQIQDRLSAVEETDPKTWVTYPYHEAPTHLRVDVVAWLPDLLETIEARVAEMIPKLAHASERVEICLAAMKGTK